MRMKHAEVVRPNYGKRSDPSTLPGWARCCREVVELCELNSDFRRNVEGATDPVYKRVLIQQARLVVREVI